MVLENKIKNQLLYIFMFFLLNAGIILTDPPIYERSVTHSLMIFLSF